MEDKKLIQLLSKLNNCKQGTADDIRLQELLNTTLCKSSKKRKS